MLSVQVAISLALLASAGLFIRSLNNIRSINVGFRADHVLQITLNPSDYAPERLAGFYKQLVEQVRSLPGVQAATFGRQRLIANASWSSGIVVPGFNPPEGDRGPNRDAIGGNYFSSLGIPLLAGREFTDADTAAAPKVTIVNEAFAHFYFGDQDPLGKRIGPGGDKPEFTVVGCDEEREIQSHAGSPDAILVCALCATRRTEQFPRIDSFRPYFIGSNSMANNVRAAVARVDKTIALFDIKTIDAQIEDNIRLEKLLATLSIFFGVVAALLAGAGLFGVLAYSVSQRKREIGIRIAIGARPAQAAWGVVRSVGFFVVVGVFGGVALALSLSSVMRGLLFGVQPNDPLTLAIAALAICAIAMLAALLPAAQAAKTEPASVLRSN